MLQPEELHRDEQSELQILYEILGSKQLKRKELELAPACLLDIAVSDEINNNWADAYKAVSETDVFEGANVIGSHIIYKIKLEEHGKRLKARLCPDGNRDKEKMEFEKIHPPLNLTSSY